MGQKGKRAALTENSVLLLNNQLAAKSTWTEAGIDQRGHELTERVLRIWPGPGSAA